MQNQISVLYQDKNFLAVYKPAGVLVHAAYSMKHGAKNNTENASCSMHYASGTLVDWLIKKYPEIKNIGDAPEIRPGIVHRLDKGTSGVILIPRNQKYFEYLKNLFQTHQIEKTYLALVYGRVEPKTGIIKKAIYLKPGTIKRSVWQGKMEKEAITEYKVIEFLKFKADKEEKIFSLIKIFPKTGRTHQIRIHLASIGHPIVGDNLYGKKTDPFNLKRLFLHAESLEFSPSEGKRLKIEAELPDELNLILETLTNK